MTVSLVTIASLSLDVLVFGQALQSIVSETSYTAEVRWLIRCESKDFSILLKTRGNMGNLAFIAVPRSRNSVEQMVVCDMITFGLPVSTPNGFWIL